MDELQVDTMQWAVESVIQLDAIHWRHWDVFIKSCYYLDVLRMYVPVESVARAVRRQSVPIW